MINQVTNQKSYYIIKMIANEGRGNDQEAYLDELIESAQQALLDWCL